jgi:hypothetical protein
MDASSRERPLDDTTDGDARDVAGESGRSRVLNKMSTRKLKWGVVSRAANTPDSPGHLSFGTEDQDVVPPVDGNWYAG